MTAPAKPSNNAFLVFRNRNFTQLLLAMLISEFGTGITSIAASILVYRETGSALSVGLMLMATSLPGLLFGLVAGVFVDRHDRKKILVATEIISGILILMIPLALSMSSNVLWLYLFIALKGTTYQFFSPAHNAVIPEVATDEELAAANSFITVIQTGALGLGFATAGIITSQLNPDFAFIIDGCTFLLSGFIISRIHIPNSKPDTSSSVESIMTNLREGASFLWHSPPLRSLLFVGVPIGVSFGFFNSAALPFAREALGASEFQYSLIEGIGLAGFVLGGITMTIIADRLREGQWVAISFLGMGTLAVIYSQINSVALAIILSTMILFFNVPSFIGRRLVIQRNTTREVRGRVSSVLFVVRDFSLVAGMAAVGIADVLPIRDTLLIMGLIILCVGFISLYLPGLKRPASEWRHSLEMLRGISEAEGLSTGRSVTIEDLEKLKTIFPAIVELETVDLQQIMSGITCADAQPGTVIVHQGDHSDSAYIILEGRMVVGNVVDDKERVLEYLNAGDFFGEIAALSHVPRTANVVAETEARLLRVPANTLLAMAAHPTLNRLFYSVMMERMMNMNLLDLPRRTGPHQEISRALRTETMQMAAISV